jgi:diaminopimelate decarboxylase
VGAGVLGAAAAPAAAPSAADAGFRLVDRVLHADQVPLPAIAEAAGTPCYVYSAGVVRRQYRRVAAAFAGAPHRIHYSVKANSNLALLRLLRGEGAAADVVSGGELYRAREAGFGPGEVVFGGVGKTARELGEALAAGVLFVNVESEGELILLDAVARERGVIAPAALRVNPGVSVETPHHYIRTGEEGHKFGIPFDEVQSAAELARSLPNVRLVGLDMHIGSQLATYDPYGAALLRLLGLLTRLRADGADAIEYLDVGGGLSVRYRDEEPADVERVARGIVEATRGLGLTLVLEPGRFMVAESGLVLARVLYRKRSGGKEVVITDAGMNDLIRPSHYAAYHEVTAVARAGARSRPTWWARCARRATSSRSTAPPTTCARATSWPCTRPARTGS